MSFGSSNDPCALIKISGIGNSTPEFYMIACQKLTELIAQEYKID